MALAVVLVLCVLLANTDYFVRDPVVFQEQKMSTIADFTVGKEQEEEAELDHVAEGKVKRGASAAAKVAQLRSRLADTVGML